MENRAQLIEEDNKYELFFMHKVSQRIIIQRDTRRL